MSVQPTTNDEGAGDGWTSSRLLRMEDGAASLQSEGMVAEGSAELEQRAATPTRSGSSSRRSSNDSTIQSLSLSGMVCDGDQSDVSALGTSGHGNNPMEEEAAVRGGGRSSRGAVGGGAEATDDKDGDDSTNSGCDGSLPSLIREMIHNDQGGGEDKSRQGDEADQTTPPASGGGSLCGGSASGGMRRSSHERSKMHDSGLVTEVRHNYSRGRNQDEGGGRRGSSSVEGSIEEEEDDEDDDDEQQLLRQEQARREDDATQSSMTLADLANHSLSNHGQGQQQMKKQGSNNTVEEIIETAARARAATLIDVAYGAASAVTTSEGGTEADGISDIGASNSTRDSAAAAYTDYGGTTTTSDLYPAPAKATLQAQTNRAAAGSSGSSIPYPNLANSDPAPDPNPTPTTLRQESSIGTANSGGSWTQPAHDYMVPLTDGPKRPGRRRSRVMTNKRRGSGTGRGGGGGGNGRARSSSRRIANRGAAEARGQTTTGTTGTSSSRADNKTSKRTATTRNSAARTAPVPKTQLTYQESDSTVDSLMDVQIDTNRRNNNNNNNNSQDSGDLSLGSFATSPSLDPADIIMGLHSSNPSLDGAKVVEKAVRIKDPANTDANQRDRDEANDQYDDDHDDYSFARSLEPYSREPSLSAHYKDPQDHEEQGHSYMVPLKGQDTTPPTSGNGKEHHPPSRSGSRRAAEGGGGGGRRDRGGEARRSLRQRASSTWSTDSIGSILNSIIFGNGDDMTLTGEASRDEQGGLLDAVDAEYDDDDEYIDMQQDDDLEGTYHTQQSWVPSVVMDARSGGQSLDGTTHSRLTMDEGLNARPDEDNHANGRSRSSSRDRSENKRRFRRAERAEQLRRSRARDEGGDSFDGSQNSFQDSADGMSLLENSRDARDRQGQRGKMKRRPSFDMMDELARKVGDRLMRQQRSRSGSRSRSRSSDDRSRGDYSIALSNRGIPDLHDNEIIDIDDEDYRRCHTGGYTYGYDQRKNSFKIARTGYYSMCQSHKRTVLLVAAAAAIIVGLSVNFGPNNGGITSSDVPIGPGGGGWGGGGIHEVEEEEPLVPSITQALEEELKRRKQLDTEDDSHEQEPEEEGDPDEIFASDGKKKKKKKKGPLRLLVECTRDEGCFEAMQASNFKVHIEDIKNSHMVSVDIDDFDFDKLRELHHVKRIDLDFGIDGIEDVLVDESEIDDEDKDLLRTSEGAVKEGPRTLAQTVPDGAIMVQAVSWDGKTFEETHGPGIAPRKICIADTGACRDHPDIDSQPSHLYGTDMVLDRDRVLPWYPDRNGHGCHLTGLIAGLDNDIGYHGISTATGAVKVFSTRALGDDMSGSLSQMQAAIDQCVSNDADVIVLSLGCTNCYSQSMKEYFDRIAKKNIMVFAAAGNNGAEDYPAKFYPASYPSVISIGAVNKHRGRWYMSNKNDGIEFCAHGYYVYSTDFDLLSDNRFSWNYNPRAGTSMACPQAAAVAAMLWSHFPSCTALDIRAALAHTAKHHAGHASCNTECGFGIVQLSDAYDFLSDKGCSGVHPILSSSSSTCDCVDSNYQSYSCRRPAQSYSSPQQSSSDQPLCKDNNRAKFTINSRRELLATFGLGGNRNKRRRRKGCAYIRKRKSRAIKWCRQSGKAQQNCKKTCSEKGGISYPDCRPSTQ